MYSELSVKSSIRLYSMDSVVRSAVPLFFAHRIPPLNPQYTWQRSIS